MLLEPSSGSQPNAAPRPRAELGRRLTGRSGRLERTEHDCIWFMLSTDTVLPLSSSSSSPSSFSSPSSSPPSSSSSVQSESGGISVEALPPALAVVLDLLGWVCVQMSLTRLSLSRQSVQFSPSLDGKSHRESRAMCGLRRTQKRTISSHNKAAQCTHTLIPTRP